VTIGKPASITVLILAVGMNVATAQEQRICAPRRIDTPPLIDGKLSDAAWSETATLGGFTVRGTDQPADPPTEIKLLFDDSALYLGIRCLEPEPDSLSRSYRERDDEVWRHDDCIQVYIDESFLPESSPSTAHYYRFALNANSVQFDAKDGGEGWNGQWQSAVVAGGDHWTAELAILWSSFERSRAPEGIWRIQVYRHRTIGSQEFSNWSPGEGSWYDGQRFGYMAMSNPAGPLRVASQNVMTQLPTVAARINKLDDSPLVDLTSLGRRLEEVRSLANKAVERAREKEPDIKRLFATQAVAEEAAGKLARLQGTVALQTQLAAKRKLPHCLLVPVDSMVQVQRELDRNNLSLLSRTANPALQLDGARGEYVHGQIAVIPTKTDLKNVTWQASTLLGWEGAEIPLSVRVVGYLKTEQPPYKVDAVGWWPDPLLDYLDTFDVPLQNCQPLWVTVAVPRDTKPGRYKGQVRVRSGDLEWVLPVELRVRPFAIPKKRHLRVAPGYQVGKLAELHDPDAWNKRFKWKYRQFLLDHGLNVTSIYVTDAPLLEESVEDLRRLRDSGQDIFVIWSLYEDELNGRAVQITKLLERCRQAGIPDEALFFYGFDEVREDARPALVEAGKTAKRLFPQVNTMTTAIFKDLGAKDDLSSTIDAWCPPLPNYVGWEQACQAARARGKQVWWYTCCWPGHPYPNFFIEYPAIESRLLTGVFPWKYQPDGFLYYAINIGSGGHLNGTRGDTPLCEWNPQSFKTYNGDGCLFYPGLDGPISTIRLENFTDGLEDYEYFWLLRDLSNRLSESDLAHTSEGKAVLAEARTSLTIPVSIVSSLTAYTRDPAALRRVRTQVAEAIENILALGIDQK